MILLIANIELGKRLYSSFQIFAISKLKRIVLFWTVNNSCQNLISIISIIYLTRSCLFGRGSEAPKPPILCPRIQRGYGISCADTSSRQTRCIIDCHNRSNFFKQAFEQNIERFKFKHGQNYSFKSLQLSMELQIL